MQRKICAYKYDEVEGRLKYECITLDSKNKKEVLLYYSIVIDNRPHLLLLGGDLRAIVLDTTNPYFLEMYYNFDFHKWMPMDDMYVNTICFSEKYFDKLQLDISYCKKYEDKKARISIKFKQLEYISIDSLYYNKLTNIECDTSNFKQMFSQLPDSSKAFILLSENYHL